MTKIHGTRKQKALELFEKIAKGPSITDIKGQNLTKEQKEDLKWHYDLWFKSWIGPILLDAVPELRDIDAIQTLRAKGLLWD